MDIVIKTTHDTLGDYTGIYSYAYLFRQYRKSTFPLRIHDTHNNHQSFRGIAEQRSWLMGPQDHWSSMKALASLMTIPVTTQCLRC